MLLLSVLRMPLNRVCRVSLLCIPPFLQTSNVFHKSLTLLRDMIISLTFSKKMEDANVDPEDYYDQVTDVDAHAV